MIDTAKYHHYRFSESFNCADFARLVAKDNGIDYPIGNVDHNSNEVVANSIASSLPLFERTDSPQDFDLIYIRESDGRRHIGLYFKYGKIYHLKREGSPVFQKLTAEHQVIGFYRLRDSGNA